MSAIMAIPTLPVERFADCVNRVVDIVGRDLTGLDRQVIAAALDFADDDKSIDDYVGPFRVDGGYGDLLGEVVAATARFLNQNAAATDDQKRRYRLIAHVGMG